MQQGTWLQQTCQRGLRNRSNAGWVQCVARVLKTTKKQCLGLIVIIQLGMFCCSNDSTRTLFSNTSADVLLLDSGSHIQVPQSTDQRAFDARQIFPMSYYAGSQDVQQLSTVGQSHHRRLRFHPILLTLASFEATSWSDSLRGACFGTWATFSPSSRNRLR